MDWMSDGPALHVVASVGAVSAVSSSWFFTSC